MDAETTLHALSIALSHASGTTEYTSTGGSIKRLHAGIGTRNGIVSADMARAGITGPRSFLSGNKRFFRTLLQRGPAEGAEERLSLKQPFEIGTVWLKAYCCCYCIHSYIDAMRPFAERRAEISEVLVRIQHMSNVVVGTANANAYEPKNIEHVQFSLPMQMAFALHGKGNGYRVHRDYLDGKVDMGQSCPLHAASGLSKRPSSTSDTRENSSPMRRCLLQVGRTVPLAFISYRED